MFTMRSKAKTEAHVQLKSQIQDIFARRYEPDYQPKPRGRQCFKIRNNDKWKRACSFVFLG